MEMPCYGAILPFDLTNKEGAEWVEDEMRGSYQLRCKLR